MDVFLIRHAEAIDETRELRDPMRHLTLRGREQATALGDRLRWHDCTPTKVWTSPLVRAVQTAELVASAIASPGSAGVRSAPEGSAESINRASKVPIEVMPALAPGEDLRAVIAHLKALPADAVVLLVGHEPGMSGIGALLVGASDFDALGKAEAARILDGQLRWRCAWNSEAPVR